MVGTLSQSARVHPLGQRLHQDYFRGKKCVAHPPNTAKEAAKRTWALEWYVGVKRIPDAYNQCAEAKVEDFKGPADLRTLDPVKRRTTIRGSTRKVFHL